MDTTSESGDRKFDTAKDPLDLRDLTYEGSLRELPFAVDNRKQVPIILNQGTEGACTGFGLAAVVNFLLYNRSDRSAIERKKLLNPENGASARMLYEMAKRYDEWEGENYSGSSIRGAMKGWLSHGVCSSQTWPYENDAGRLNPERQFEALGRPLSSYLRVRHLHLNQMHSALNEVGILYGSASVHQGWYEVDEAGKIPYRSDKIGGHAFAIVGYDEGGFWVKNSWGATWGKGGFCRISYDDWLENAYDCWVARLGVPTNSIALEGGSDRERVTAFDYIPHEAVVLSKIRPHFVNLGNDGRLSASGIYSNTADDVDDVIGGFKASAAASDSPARLILYAHGGLNNEKSSASRIASLLPYFVANGIYPVHFMWESGLGDSLTCIVEDAFRSRRFQGWGDGLKDKFYDLLDEAIELAARGLGRSVWAQMKDNARRATADTGGGARYTAVRIRECFTELGAGAELHLVGHSAGCIFHAHLIPLLMELGLPIKTLTLFAPASTIELFKKNVLPHVGAGIGRLTIFNLTDQTEQDDRVTSAYHKSLLYLVSEALESRRSAPLLGMQAYLNPKKKPAPIKKLGKPVFSNERAVVYSLGGPKKVKLASNSSSHGGFDNDGATLNSMLRIIRGSNKLPKEFSTT